LVHVVINSMAPKSVIDIGVGYGKTGVLLRQFLDVARKRYRPDEWQAEIYGIETFGEYHNPLWDYAYNRVVIADALDGLDQLPDVDLIVALDVWEHFRRDYAHRLLEKCLDKARFLILCTPIDPLPQGAVFGNAHEEHISRWEPRDFAAVPQRRVLTTGEDWVLVLSRGELPPYEAWKLSSPLDVAMEGLRNAWRLWRHRA